MAVLSKVSGAMGSALPDPVKDNAAIQPIPSPVVENKPAPGQTGPKGLAPRTTYSRVNTGSPPTMDAGATAQKNGPPRGMEFLPAKVAARRGDMTTIQTRPAIQDLVKAAMASTSRHLQVNIEAARQAAQQGEVKTASARPTPTSSNHVSTELVMKLADAVDYVRQQIVKEADLGPGEGPGALHVMQAESSEANLDTHDLGQATGKNQPPKNPPLQAEKVQEGKANTGLETNDDTTHPAQPVEPIHNEKVSSLQQRNMARLLKTAGVGDALREAATKVKGYGGKALEVARANPLATAGAAGAAGLGVGAGAGYALGHSGNKQASASAAPLALIRKLAGKSKKAEDAINPAQISAPANVDPLAPPPGATEAGEGVPAEPSDVNSQKRLISSNEAAINYTKRDAKADPKSDVAQVLSEPPLSASTDPVLNHAFDNTSRAGVKISSARAMHKTAHQMGATRALLGRLLEKAAAQTNATTGT